MSIAKGAAEENGQALIIFPLANEWKQLLLTHGCSFGPHEYGETATFPEGTTRTMLLTRTGQPTNRYRLLFPDGVELREVVDDEGTGKSWLLLLKPGADERHLSNASSGRTKGEGQGPTI